MFMDRSYAYDLSQEFFLNHDSLFAHNYFSPMRIFADFGYVIVLKIALPTIPNM